MTIFKLSLKISDMWRIACVFFYWVVWNGAGLACPDQDSGLKRWSDPATWPTQTKPTNGDSVVIQQGMYVLLDEDVDVKNIHIKTGGRLVWDSSRDTKVTTNYVLVEGTMEIGAEGCQFSKKAEIMLTGKMGDYPDVPECGQKFICVTAGGTLELHGKDKLSWTRLDTQLDKPTSGLFYSFQSTKEAEMDWKEGLRVWAFKPGFTDVTPQQKMFYLSGKNKWLTDTSLQEIDPFIKNIQDGSIVTVALLRQLKGTRDLSSVYSLLENQLGAKRIREVDGDDTYTLITVKGVPESTIEEIDNTGRPLRKSQLSMDFPTSNKVVHVQSQLKNDNWFENKVECGLYSMEAANPKVKLAETSYGWEEGDKVLVTSTDFDMEQAEIGYVKNCDDCLENEIRISFIPQYTHYSKLDYNVDMRAEIAVLNRNIIIRGEMENGCPSVNGNCDKWKFDTFGGHVKFLRHFKDVHIEGVELVNMGQQTTLGNYPLHFHMCHDLEQGYTNPPYLRYNSIYRTFARCITIHGTHGAQVIDNVCYDTLGHSIFLEDGGEKNTVIDGNLVAVTRKGGLIPADEKPSSYWITNPHTTVRNNVAAGSEQMGFWFIYPHEPTGPSRAENFMARDEAKHTKIREVRNNLAHSNFMSGLFIDGIINDNLQVDMFGKNGYYPRTMPKDPKNKEAQDDPVYIEKQTSWKNRIFNTWLAGGYLVMKHYSAADSSKALQMVRVSDQEQFLEHSVLLGETDNIGEPSSVWNKELKKNLGYPRSLVMPWDPKTPIQGLTFYNGPTYADNVWFNFFTPTENYTSSAIGFNRQHKHATSAVTAMTGIQFGFNDPSEGNRLYDGNATVHGFSDLDGDKGATVRDEDGSISMATGFQQIVKPGRFYTTSLCKFRPNWNMALCPYKYGKIDVDIDASSPERGQTDAIMVRDDEPDHPEILHDHFTADFMAILGGTHSYTLHWSKKVPSKFWIWGKGVEKNQFVRIGVCLSPDAKFNLFTWSPQWRPTTSTWKQKSSIEELDQDTIGDAYYFDSEIGMLFIKFINYKERTSSTTKECDGWCPVVQITVTSGDRSSGNCQQKAYVSPGKYRKQSQGPMTKEDNTVLPATSNRPPAGWGAGSQVPFRKPVVTVTTPKPNTPQTTTPVTTVTAVDGAFSLWGSWSPCVAVHCEGVQTRERKCDNPPPSNDGRSCTGSVKEQQSCNNCSLPPAA